MQRESRESYATFLSDKVAVSVSAIHADAFYRDVVRARVIANVAAYRSFSPAEIELRAFLERWLPGLERDGLKVGLNWSGERAAGYDVDPQEVASRLAAALSADL